MNPYTAALLGLVVGFAIAEASARIPANFGHSDASQNLTVTNSILIGISVLLGGILSVLLFQATR